MDNLYEDKVEQALVENSGQKPAMVWAIMSIAKAILALADAVRYRTMDLSSTPVVPFHQPPTVDDPPYVITCTAQEGLPELVLPMCPFCAGVLDGAGKCNNLTCKGGGSGENFGAYGSIGDEPV